MHRRTFAFALGIAAIGCSVRRDGGAPHRMQQVYRYVDKDGRVVYSDRGPPSDAKDVQAKRPARQRHRGQRDPDRRAAGAGALPGDAVLVRLRRGLHAGRGAAQPARRPFTTVNVEEPEGAEQLKKMTGELRAPVLQVGDRPSSRDTPKRSGTARSTTPATRRRSRRAARLPDAPLRPNRLPPPQPPPHPTSLAHVNAPAPYPRQ